jgi:hypothetical protein
MINFEFHTPTKVVFGKDAESTVGAQVNQFGGTKVLIHWGGDYVRATGLLDRVHASLEAEGIAYVDFDGVVPNPRLSHCLQGLEIAKAEGVDFVLAIGGGSAIDSSKCIAYGLVNDFDLVDLFMGRVSTTEIAPIGCISTLAGTGSETSNSTVINIDTLGGEMLKRSYNHDCARPLFAIMDPELTYGVPPYQTAAGGSDIMMHTMERYFTPTKDVALIDAMSEGLLRTVKEAVPAALANPCDYEARANLLWAGSLSHNGLTGTGRVGDFASHAIEHEMGALFDVTHGAGLCAMWSSWARYVIDEDPERFAQFAVNVFGVTNDFHDPKATGLAGIAAWEDWCHKIGMPTSMTELGIDPTDEQIREMAEGAVAARGGNLGAFKHLEADDVVAILTAAR